MVSTKKTSLRRLPVHGDTGPVMQWVGSCRFLSQHDAQHDGCCAVKLERLLLLRGTRGTWYIWHIYQINDTLFLSILFHICFCRHAGRQRFLLYDYLVSAVSFPCKGWSLCNSNLHNFESHAVSVPLVPFSLRAARVCSVLAVYAMWPCPRHKLRIYRYLNIHALLLTLPTSKKWSPLCYVKWLHLLRQYVCTANVKRQTRNQQLLVLRHSLVLRRSIHATDICMRLDENNLEGKPRKWFYEKSAVSWIGS